MRHETCDMRHVTCDMRHETCHKPHDTHVRDLQDQAAPRRVGCGTVGVGRCWLARQPSEGLRRGVTAVGGVGEEVSLQDLARAQKDLCRYQRLDALRLRKGASRHTRLS